MAQEVGAGGSDSPFPSVAARICFASPALNDRVRLGDNPADAS